MKTIIIKTKDKKERAEWISWCELKNYKYIIK